MGRGEIGRGGEGGRGERRKETIDNEVCKGF